MQNLKNRCIAILLLGLCGAACLAGCRQSPVFVAERSAPVGNEFIRLYKDGHAEYGYVVVRENLKAQGNYRYAHDTVWFLSDSFKPHFPAGYLPIKDDVLYMESGLHFKIKKNELK
ncbi:MAG: hypothetical protein JWO30_1049 [Fibrobacteres bacterium]|nr:hypothetical protein [Fibrobacterota bacterium]